ncbi:MAG: WYL domain-containing protein [Acidobacteriota bacterium]|nr:WYL domain-containing protein [Acidobacteriota bacterium]MXX85978.1 WYL domain-containing protein [Acidobacteriota bacterium]MYF78194.1 WYL domain-containing protein [Acidobacteriota bacterium]MYG75271.1 WYL domain-containing protein [Acidobacteriota bacterium]
MASSIARTATLFRKLLSGRRVTYRQLEAEENINRRTALRWIAEARRVFDDALHSATGDTGEKEFWLETRGSHWMGVFKHQPPNPEEMASLDKAIRILRREGLAHEEDQLTALRGKLHGVVERRDQAASVENDVEAITDAWGIASRPGPHIRADEDVTATLRDALLRQRKVGFRYRGGTSKTVEPAGLLYGGAPRLVGKEKGRDLAQYRLDRMSDVKVLDTPNRLREDALQNYLSRLFGSFGEEPVNVQWRFHPEAPEPEKWTFHPTQKVEKDADGVVTVSFRAGGLDDMARHVIGWWDWIQVDKPIALRRAVLKMRLAGLAQLLYEFADQRTATRIWNLTEELGANKVDYWE